jgi:aminoglycoside phosphotransferase (APT) family kinase protein
MGSDELQASLAALLGADGADIRIDGLRRLSGGASRETWSFDAVIDGIHRPLILQRLRPGASRSTTSIPIATEAAVLRAAAGSGVPTAEVVADDDGAILGSPGMVVQRLDGETIARKLLRDDEYATARELLGAQAAGALARVHSIPADAVPGLRTADQVEQFRDVLDALGEPHPAFELGFRWLEANRPAASRIAVVHGDFRLGNLLVDRDGLRAVLDWELVHLGDPLEDLGWFCVRAWRFGSPLAAGGVTTREALVDAYEAAGGAAVDLDVLRWWEVLGTLKWGVMCVMQAWGHLSGASRSVELATIGRRVCENEWDLLGLLPGGPLPASGTSPSAAPTRLHDRPTLAELVEAVREWVATDVQEGTEGRLAFHARVAGNALRIVEREIALEPALTEAHRRRLADLGCEDDRALVARIRSGELDDRAAEIRLVVGASVRDKLLVANPPWLES